MTFSGNKTSYNYIFGGNLDVYGRLNVGNDAFFAKNVTIGVDSKLDVEGRAFFNENVGIGTDNPNATLHVQNNANAPGGNIQRWTADTGTNVRSASLLAPAIDDINEPFTFFTNNAWNFRVDSTDALTITADAKIGIGIDNPTEKLEVVSTNNMIKSRSTGDSTGKVALDSNRAAGSIGGQILGQWNGNTVSRIDFRNGADGTNKDDGLISFGTSSSGSNPTEKLRIASAGQIGLSGANYGTNNQVITSTGTGSAPEWRGVNAAFYGRQDTSHNVAHATWTVVKNLGNDAVNTTGWNESTGVFTANADTAGTWYIFGNAGIDDVQSLDVVYMGIMKNGANPPVYTYSRMYSGAANQILGGGMVAGIFTLADGDTISVAVYHNEGTTEPTEQNRCFVGGFRLSV